MVDGVSATDLMTVMFGEDVPAGSASSWQPAPEPSEAELVLRTLAHQALNRSEQVRIVRAVVRRPRTSLGQAAGVVRGAMSASGLLRPIGRSSLTGRVGPHRTWSSAYVHLGDVKAVRAAVGGTVNDVVLTLAAGGLRELLEARGEQVQGQTVRALVPVSVRRPDEHGAYNNRVSGMVARLPIGIIDPVARLNAVRVQMDGLKQSKQAVAGDVLTSLSGFAPPMLLALAGRLAARSPTLGLQTGVTNVPGPQIPLHTLGRRLLESYPFVPLIGPARISIAIFSYNGGLYFGVTGDYESSRDVDILTAGVQRSMAELLDAVDGSTGGVSDIHPGQTLAEPTEPGVTPPRPTA